MDGSGSGVAADSKVAVTQSDDNVKLPGYDEHKSSSHEHHVIHEIKTFENESEGRDKSDYVSGDHSLHDQETSKLITTAVEMTVTPALMSDTVTRSISKELSDDMNDEEEDEAGTADRPQ